MYPKSGDDEEYTGDTDEQPGGIDEKSKGCLSQTIDSAHKGGVRLEKGADPCKSEDESSRGIAMEEEAPDEIAEQKKEQAAR